MNHVLQAKCLTLLLVCHPLAIFGWRREVSLIRMLFHIFMISSEEFVSPVELVGTCDLNNVALTPQILILGQMNTSKLSRELIDWESIIQRACAAFATDVARVEA